MSIIKIGHTSKLEKWLLTDSWLLFQVTAIINISLLVSAPWYPCQFHGIIAAIGNIASMQALASLVVSIIALLFTLASQLYYKNVLLETNTPIKFHI